MNSTYDTRSDLAAGYAAGLCLATDAPVDVPNLPDRAHDALRSYCSFLLSRVEPDGFFRTSFLRGKRNWAWYEAMIAVRGLLGGWQVLGDQRCLDAAVRASDLFVDQQLPNGAWCADHDRDWRKIPPLQRLEYRRTHGSLNLADNGTNAYAVLQTARFVDKARRQRYLDAVCRWVDEWVRPWELPEGALANGIWRGKPSHDPYTTAIAQVAVVLGLLWRMVGRQADLDLLKRIWPVQLDAWCDDGRPIVLNPYGVEVGMDRVPIEDYAHGYYLLDGLVWTFATITDGPLHPRLGERIDAMLCGKRGLLRQWYYDYFDVMPANAVERRPFDGHTTMELHLPWHLPKSAGIAALLAWYQRLVQADPLVCQRFHQAIDFLTQPEKAKVIGVTTDEHSCCGLCTCQATGFAAMSLAEYLKPGANFDATIDR